MVRDLQFFLWVVLVLAAVLALGIAIIVVQLTGDVEMRHWD